MPSRASIQRVAQGLSVASLLVAAACSGGSGGSGGGDGAQGAPSDASRRVAHFRDYDAGSVPGGPGAQARFAIGRAAATADIARWDIDVGPDGAELPPGKGSVAEGRVLYEQQCATCHNTNGEGKPPKYPQLIGRDSASEGFHFATNTKAVKTIGNYWPHATTVFDYVRRAMPLTTPGTLTDDQVYALTAFLLAANKVIPEDAVLDAASLKAVKMPYADRFVPDNRRGGPEVK